MHRTVTGTPPLHWYQENTTLPVSATRASEKHFSALGPPWRSHPGIEGYPQCQRVRAVDLERSDRWNQPISEAQSGFTVYVTGLLPHYVSLNPLVLAVIKDIWQLPSRALDTKGEAPVSLTEHHLASGVEQRSTT